MPARLLERDRTLEALERAVTEAAAGRGSVALITGEPGIGKTSLVRAFAAGAAERARVLLSACDDLMAPRTLGPLRDAAAGSDGPLAAALAEEGSVDAVFGALLEELAAQPPTVLVVEDLHWADDATLDVLGYAARRIEPVGALIALTCRDDQVDPRHPLHRFLGVLAGSPVRRLALRPLSHLGVRELAAGTGADADAVYRVTRGNPFFVTEVLASPGDAVPVSVVDAVLARVRRLGAECREALDQLSVIPRQVDLELAYAVLGTRIDALAEAQAAGVLEDRADSIAFRHELARRAIEHSLPAIRRRQLNQSVVAALHAQERPERARLMHHAVEARDVDTIVAVGPAAAHEAAQAGSHRQALAHFESVLPHLDRLGERERAAVLDAYGWELYNAHRFREAVEASRAAVALYEGLDDPVAAGECLVRLSRHLYMAGDTDAAEVNAQRAVMTLEPTGHGAALAHASLNEGAILAMTEEDPARTTEILASARELATRAARPDLAALALDYLGMAHVQGGDPEGVELLRQSIAAAEQARQYEYAARGYCNLAELLFRAGMLDELEACVEEGMPYVRERGFWSHAYGLELHRCAALMRRGRWEPALAGLRALVDDVDDPGMLYAYSAPLLGRLLARRGEAEAAPMLAAAWSRAVRQRLLIGLAYAGLASVERAWLVGDQLAAQRVADVLEPRTRHAGAAPFRAELLRYLARCGLDAEPFEGCPEPWAAGLRGDWEAAAAGWEAAGDPYEQALELAESGEPEPTLAAVRMLDGLGATAAELARERLRAMGTTVPRRPQAATRANPAGLTSRQLAVLGLVSEGMTNAEIADRLVVSVRTVDHHVAAVLGKLGVRSRRDAAAAAHELGISPPGVR
jgi:DNA-binding CsgD family transcriptional regulator